MRQCVRPLLMVTAALVTMVGVTPLDAASASGVVPSWTTVSPMPTARCGLAATAGLDGRIWALGGGCFGDNRDTMEVYQPATGAWTTQSPMPTARRFLAAATGADGRIYAIGGVGRPTGAPFERYLNTVEAYTPLTGTWTTVAPMPTARATLAAATGPDGRIYAIGGCCDPVTNHAFTTVEAYTPSTNTWATVSPLPTARDLLAAAVGPDGRIYAIGGRLDVTNTNCCPVPNVDAYTPATNIWESVAALPVATEGHAAATGIDGRIYAFGGNNDGNLLNNAEAYDPSTNTWAAIEPMPTGRTTLAAARGGDGRIYAVGGVAFATVLNSAEALTTPASVPTSKRQCKKGGWHKFGFKNQGQCVAFVEHHTK